LVRLEGLMAVQPRDRVIREILAEVVALLGRLRRQHARRVADQVRLVLRSLAGEEAVEVLEADLARPVVKRARRRRLDRGRVVPLAKRRGRVPVVLEDLGAERAALGDFTGVA